MARFKEFDPFAAPGGAAPASGPGAVACNPALLRLVASRQVLLLQGPVGPFFDRLAQWLTGQGVQVQRVVFQAGDEADCRALAPIRFTGRPEEWPAFFDQLLERHAFDCIVLFGQARSYHVSAIQRAQALGLAVVVLEEGYFRPGYVTMELGGVNGYSTTLQRHAWNPAAPGPALELHKPPSTEGQFGQMARHAMRHYLAMRLGHKRYPHYIHHKSTSLVFYARYWLGSWLKKALHLWADTARVRELASAFYFFIPLQHDGDAQITHHSTYGENTEFIIEVLRSFADNAPPEALLVFRQHPFSRGGPGHVALIRSLAAELGVGKRVLHLVEGHTPTLVRQSRGVVLINSTVGFQALSYGTPLMVLGDALYKEPEVTFQGPLSDFWQHAGPPSPEHCKALLDQIRHLTQVPCNAYGLATEPLPWHRLPQTGAVAPGHPTP